MARFEFKFKGQENAQAWIEDRAEIVLPDAHAPLKEQRAAMRALRAIFPGADVKLLSHTDLEDGSAVTRTVKMDINHPKRESGHA